MRTMIANLWRFHEGHAWAVIPTNLTVTVSGEAVMGRGVALAAQQKFPSLPARYGAWLREHQCAIASTSDRRPNAKPGAGVMVLPDWRLILLPTKYHWRYPSDLSLIRDGLRCLSTDSRLLGHTIVLPLLGCGLGQLAPDVVRPILETTLDDRFTLCLPNR